MGYQIVFQPSGIRCENGTSDESLLQIAQRVGVEINVACGGRGTCGKCKIKIISENITNNDSDSINYLTPLTYEERGLLSAEELKSGIRLACMVRPCGDLVVEIPQSSQTSKQIVLLDGKSRRIPLNPAVKTYTVKLHRATLDDHRDDLTRLCNVLHEEYPQLPERLEIVYPVMSCLSERIRKGRWTVTAVVWQSRKIIDIRCGNNQNCYGVAVDIGTTTLAAYLCDLSTGEVLQTSSMVNPQVRFGDDVLSRISYCMLQTDGLNRLHKLLIYALNDMVLEMTQKEGISDEYIAEYVLAGNTVMQHIALEIPPDTIGASPFVSTMNAAVDISARELGLKGMPGANAHFLPSAAGFIGADHIAVLIAEQPYKQNKMQLIIDIGTNSEICFGNKENLYVASCATGPALEGAQIQCGMRAAAGAIERVWIDPETLEPTLGLIGDVKIPLGICGSGILDAVAQMAVVGILEKNGHFSKKLQSKRIRTNADGKSEYVLYFAENSKEHDIVVTAKDVRAVQLAKSALYTGAKILMQRAGAEKADEIILAGAFGSFINRVSALQIGMFPDCIPDKISISGNAAGVGARYALLNTEKRIEAAWIAEHVKFVETAADAQFQYMFSDAMWIPHRTDTFTSLDTCSVGKGDK